MAPGYKPLSITSDRGTNPVFAILAFGAREE